MLIKFRQTYKISYYFIIELNILLNSFVWNRSLFKETRRPGNENQILSSENRTCFILNRLVLSSILSIRIKINARFGHWSIINKRFTIFIWNQNVLQMSSLDFAINKEEYATFNFEIYCNWDFFCTNKIEI